MPNVKETKTYYTSALLCSSIADPPQHATIITKTDSGASNNYWRTEDMVVLSNLKYTRNVHPKWTNSSVAKQRNCECDKDRDPSTIKRSNHPGKKAHIFYGLHIASLISLEKLCDKDCISILDKNEINIIKYKTLLLKGHVNNTYGLCYIPISRSLRHHAHATITRDKTKTELIQYLH